METGFMRFHLATEVCGHVSSLPYKAMRELADSHGKTEDLLIAYSRAMRRLLAHNAQDYTLGELRPPVVDLVALTITQATSSSGMTFGYNSCSSLLQLTTTEKDRDPNNGTMLVLHWLAGKSLHLKNGKPSRRAVLQAVALLAPIMDDGQILALAEDAGDKFNIDVVWAAIDGLRNHVREVEEDATLQDAWAARHPHDISPPASTHVEQAKRVVQGIDPDYDIFPSE